MTRHDPAADPGPLAGRPATRPARPAFGVTDDPVPHELVGPDGPDEGLLALAAAVRAGHTVLAGYERRRAAIHEATVEFPPARTGVEPAAERLVQACRDLVEHPVGSTAHDDALRRYGSAAHAWRGCRASIARYGPDALDAPARLAAVEAEQAADPAVHALAPAQDRLTQDLRARLVTAVEQNRPLPPWVGMAAGLARLDPGDDDALDLVAETLAFRLTFGVTTQAPVIGWRPDRSDPPAAAWHAALQPRIRERGGWSI